MLGTIATTATATIVNVAMGDIMGAFGLGQDQIQWLSTGFLAAMTATMLITAWSLERFGYRASFIGALIVFIGGCVLGAASASGAEVILARVLQGAASGLIQPLAMVVISQVFPPSQRGSAMGIYGVGIVLAPALGPTVGGILVDQYDWRDVFLVVVPFCLLGIAAAVFILPGRVQSPTTSPRRFDAIGFALLVTALTTALTALSNGQRDGWARTSSLECSPCAVLTGAGFIAHELTTSQPLLSMRVFTESRFSAPASWPSRWAPAFMARPISFPSSSSRFRDLLRLVRASFSCRRGSFSLSSFRSRDVSATASLLAFRSSLALLSFLSRVGFRAASMSIRLSGAILA